MTYQWHRNEFDRWRALYPWLTHSEQVDFYNQMTKFWPDQKCYDAAPVIELCKRLGEQNPHLTVIEMGGYDGALAKDILQDNPNIARWVNNELCTSIFGREVCQDARYVGHAQHRPLWETLPIRKYSVTHPDLFIASHVIEHLSLTHFCRLAEWLRGVPVVHFQAPLPLNRGMKWDGYVGAHILPLGWEGVECVMKENRFKVIKQDRTGWRRLQTLECEKEWVTFEYQAERPEIGYSRKAHDLTEADACVMSLSEHVQEAE